MNPSAKIAIVGRPNVGKSTLFNRLIGKKHAVIAEEAGTTRDRIYQKFECGDYDTYLIDTGGIDQGKKENIESDVQAQSQVAIEEADVVVFVVNIAESLTSDDFLAAEILRKSKKPIILVASKCDNQKLEENVYNIYELGFGEPIQLSAIHKIGIETLEDTILKTLKKLKFKKRTKSKPTEDGETQICILGKPNAGKSSLVNAILGQYRTIVSDIPGTTRDTTDTPVTFNGKAYNLIDTAGLRRRGKIERGIEKFSSLRCLSAIERSDVVVLLIDGEKGISQQDCHIAQFALEQEKGLIICINKIDLILEDSEYKEKFFSRLRRKFAFVPWAPVLFISAKDSINVNEIFTISDAIMKERKKRITTAEINSFLQKITIKHLPNSTKMRKPKFMYGSQVDTCPPKFVLFFKNSPHLHFSYPRYLENSIRKEYGFDGTAIHLTFKNLSAEPKTDRR